MDLNMYSRTKAALGVVAGFAACWSAADAAPARLPAGLTSFGAVQVLADRPLSGPSASFTFSAGDFSRTGVVVANVPKDAFAASVALSPSLAWDSGYNVDVAQRFANFDGLKSPLLTGADLLSLANGGFYTGFTWMPSQTLHLRLGMAERSDRLERFSFDPVSTLPLAYDSAGSRSLMAGLDWAGNWGNVGLTAIESSQNGLPYALGNLTAAHADSGALDMAAQLKFGNGWVTSASYAQGFTQLDQQPAHAIDSGSYSIAIAKHGVFGDDAVALSFSHPAAGVLQNGFDMIAASGALPPLFAAGKVPNQAPETDLQLGYVTSFSDGAVALQANAAYQMNYQGQTGATSLSVLSRAKIKF